MHRHYKFFAYVALPLLTAAGCSGDGLVHVTGTVTHADGSPVKGEVATVFFQPISGVSAEKTAAASGAIEADGSFSLRTNRSDKGIRPTAYKVVLQVWKDYKKQIPNVPREYTSEATTPWQVTVSAGEAYFDLVIDDKKG